MCKVRILSKLIIKIKLILEEYMYFINFFNFFRFSFRLKAYHLFAGDGGGEQDDNGVGEQDDISVGEQDGFRAPNGADVVRACAVCLDEERRYVWMRRVCMFFFRAAIFVHVRRVLGG